MDTTVTTSALSMASRSATCKRLSQPPKQVLRWLFKADPEIFTETTRYDYDVLLKRLREQAFLNGGVNITFSDERGEQPIREVLHYEGGIRSFVDYIHERKKNIWDVLHEDVIYYSGDGEHSTVEVALQYNDSYNTTLLSFANNIHTADGGTHEIGFRTALLRAFNDYAKKKSGIFKKKATNTA